MRKKYCTWLFVLSSLLFVPGYSQEEDSLSVSNAIRSFFGLHQPAVGALVQMKAYSYNKDSKMILAGAGNRFYVSLHGDISKKFRYLAQGSFLDSYRLLDLKFSYNFRDYLGVDFGRMKTPFGKEFLQNEGNLLFVRQAYITSSLGPQRQDGIQLRGKLFDRRFSYSAGVFGGEGININSETGSLYVGKLSCVPIQSSSIKLDLGTSIAYSNDKEDYNDLNLYTYPGTSRKFYNADLGLDIDGYRINGEYTVMTGSTSGKPKGFYIDVSKRLTDEIDADIRFDFLQYPASYYNYYSFIYHYHGFIYRSYLAGINWYPEEGLKLQLNLEREPFRSHTTVTLMFQYSVNQEGE